MMTRILAATLAVLMPLQAVAQAAPEVEVAGSTITVTASRFQETQVLKVARGGGGAAAVGGAGWLTYVIIAGETGPFGWAAAILFLGGMTAYLAHRRLQGKEDFPPKEPVKAAPAAKPVPGS